LFDLQSKTKVMALRTECQMLHGRLCKGTSSEAKILLSFMSQISESSFQFVCSLRHHGAMGCCTCLRMLIHYMFVNSRQWRQHTIILRMRSRVWRSAMICSISDLVGSIPCNNGSDWPQWHHSATKCEGGAQSRSSPSAMARRSTDRHFVRGARNR